MKSITNLIRLLFLAIFFFTPLIFTSFNSELFELPKMYFVYALTVIIVVLHLLNHLFNDIPLFKRTVFDIPLLLFLISQAISTYISVDPHTSLFGYYSRLNGGLLSVSSYLLLYWVFVVYLDDAFKKLIINLFLFSGLLVAGYGVAQHFGIDKNMWVQDVQNRIFSTLGQPNWLAAYLCVLLPFSIHKFLSSSRLIYKSYFLFLTSCFYISLLFTKSKSGIIAAIISLFIFFVLNLAKSLQSKSFIKTIKPSLLIFFILLLPSVLINNPIKDRLIPNQTASITSPDTSLNITPSEDIRKIVWKGTYDLWQKFPIFGTGTETFAYTYYWTRPVSHNLTSEWDFLYNKAHNEYLNYLATTGTVGFITYIFVILFILLFLLKNITENKNPISIAVLASFLSILITNIAGFTVVIISIFLFLLPALVIEPESEINNSRIKKIMRQHHIFNYLSILFISIIGLYLFQKTLFYYLADITYAQSQTADGKEEYKLAYQLINTSINYRPDEPVYLSHAGLQSSKLALLANADSNGIDTQNYISQAIGHSDKAVKVSPANTNIWKERAQMYYYLSSINSDYFQESINSLAKVAVLAPTDAKTPYLIGQFLDSVNLKNEASTYYQKAIDLKSNYDHAYFALGLIQFEQKDYSKALDNFQSVLKINPQNSAAKDYIEKINNTKKPKK